MRRLVIVPEGWPCTHAECRPGYFTWNTFLCFKDEYGPAGNSYNEAGEIFWGGTSTKEDLDEVEVQPVVPVWEEYDE